MPTISMGKSPKPEQSKSFTPTAAGSVITPDAGYTLSQVTVNGDPGLSPVNIRGGSSIFGVAGDQNVVNTVAANATPDQILSGANAYAGGMNIVGTMPNIGTIWGAISDKDTPVTIPQGYHDGYGFVNIAEAEYNKIVTGNIKSGITILGVAGKSSVVETSDANAVSGDMLSGKSGYVNGSKIIGAIPSKTSATYTPGTSNQTIFAGQYLSGTQTIAGDADLVAGNIKSGVNIFGVTGTWGIQAGTTVALTKASIACYYVIGTTWKQLLAYTVAQGGIYRIRYSVASNSSGGSEPYRVYGQVYRNGTAAGSLNSSLTMTQVYLEQDLYFAAGQSLQFYGKGAVVEGVDIYCYVRNITISYLAPTFTLTYERSSP